MRSSFSLKISGANGRVVHAIRSILLGSKCPFSVRAWRHWKIHNVIAGSYATPAPPRPPLPIASLPKIGRN